MFCKSILFFLIIILICKSNARLVKTVQNQNQPNYLQKITDSEDQLNTQFYCPQKCTCETNVSNIFSNDIGYNF